MAMHEPTVTEAKCDICGTDFDADVDALLDHDCDGGNEL